MKLIALSDFRNTHEIEIENPIHEKHVHMGAIFSIGGDLPLEKMKQEDRLLVAALNAAGRIGDATNPETVKAVQAKVAAEKKREAAIAAAAPKK